MTTTNTFEYQEDFQLKLQARLNKPQNWKDVCEVIYPKDQIVHRPYQNNATVSTGTRSNALDRSTITQTNDTLTISTYKYAYQIMDMADLAQSQYADMMDIADKQGILLNEAIESALLANHTAWTDFDNSDIGGGAGDITVSTANIDDMITGLHKVIRVANGQVEMNRNGSFCIWRPADFEKLEQVMMANGFTMADIALKVGGKVGVEYMGMFHYVSNNHAANHLFAGVRKMSTIGLLRSTYGRAYFIDHPADTEDNGPVSAMGIESRVDYGLETWVNTKPIQFDVAVA